MPVPPRILLAGGGYVGLHAALRLERRLAAREADVVLVNPDNFMLFYPLLPEAASGTLEARHVAVPLRKVLRRTRVVTGRLVGLDPRQRRARIAPSDGPQAELDYDHAVLGLGSVSRLLPVPGLEEHAVGFKSIGEALYLRNHVLSRLDVAEATSDVEVRRRALTFVFVGGGYTGVEALAELEDLAADACRDLSTVRRRHMRWILVEATDRILPTVDADMSAYALRLLRRQGIEVHLKTQVEKAEEGLVRLSSGEDVATDTLVWVTGVAPHPLQRELSLPTDDQGRLPADEFLRVRGHDEHWTAGDGAAVPDPEGGEYPPTAQHAQRQGRHLADNLVAALRGQALTPFRHSSLGEMITLGNRKGAAQVWRVKVRGWPAWALRRAYYLTTVPTANRKVRILADWIVGLPFRREVVSLGPLRSPEESLDR